MKSCCTQYWTKPISFAEGNFICGNAATSLGVSPLHLCVARPRSFVSAYGQWSSRFARNDVDLRSNDVVSCGHKWKIRKHMLSDFWWGKLDSDQRSQRQQIYSLPPLATREFPLELVKGIEPSTCWLQISCSANWATPAFSSLSVYHIRHSLVKRFIGRTERKIKHGRRMSVAHIMSEWSAR